MKTDRQHYARILTIRIATEPDRFETMKRVYPEVAELATILRRYLVDAHGHWHGHKLWMALDIAEGVFDAEHTEKNDDHQK
jgi:hypothetical protein